MASESMSNPCDVVVCNPPFKLCHMCLTLYNNKEQAGVFTMDWHEIPDGTRPLILRREKHIPTSDTPDLPWHLDSDFEAAIQKHIGTMCVPWGSAFLKTTPESKGKLGYSREPISIMADVPLGLAAKMMDNPDKVKLLLNDLPQPDGCEWIYDFPKDSSLARWQWFDEVEGFEEGCVFKWLRLDADSCTII